MKISKNLNKYIFTILNNCKVNFLTYLVVSLIKYTDIEDSRE